MPVMRPGESARAASAAKVGASSPPADRSRSTPGMPRSRAAVDGERAAVPASTVRTERREQAREVGADLGGRCAGQPLDRDASRRRSAPRRGTVPRSRGRARSSTSAPAIGPGATIQTPGSGLLDGDAARLRARRSSSRCAAGSAGARPCDAGQAVVEARRGQQQARTRTGSTRTRRSSSSPPATAPVPWIGERQRPAAVVADVDAQVAQRVDRRAHRAAAGVLVAVERDRAEGEGGDRRRRTA